VYATPAVAGDLVFVGSCNGLFRALEKKTGRVKWSYDTQQDGAAVQFHTDPLVVEDLVVVGSDGAIAHLYAFERNTGKPQWKYELTPGVGSDVQRIDSNIYAVTLNDELLCLDWRTGALVWKFATGHPNDRSARTSTPAVQGNQVFFGSVDGIVHALDAHSGEVLWKRELSGSISTSVVLGGGSLYVGTSERHLYRLDPKSGAVEADFRAEEEPTGRLLFVQDCLVVFFGERQLSCVNSSLSGIRWSEATSGPWSSSKPYLLDEAVLAGNVRGEVLALRISDGSRLWSSKFDGVIRGIGSSEGTLYVGTLKGKVFAWKAGP
jgi:outer membrane protein assembly factor BamB